MNTEILPSLDRACSAKARVEGWSKEQAMGQFHMAAKKIHAEKVRGRTFTSPHLDPSHLNSPARVTHFKGLAPFKVFFDPIAQMCNFFYPKV